jgi:hypothetical protein
MIYCSCRERNVDQSYGKGGRKMGKRWLGGIVLGMSLALLLAAGCVSRDCIECVPGTVVVFSELDEKYVAKLSASLPDADGQEYCANLYQNGVPVRGGPKCGKPEATEINARFVIYCDDHVWLLLTDVAGVGPFQGKAEDPFGEWQLGAALADENSSQALDDWDWVIGWQVAEVCDPEFVPEPASIALLGGGLAGLAGYAGLRWRKRQ